MGSIPNGVNNHSLDLPDYTGAAQPESRIPAMALPYFNIRRLHPECIGYAGLCLAPGFLWPRIVQFDLALLRNFRFSETRALQFRLEAFNAFNHAQFFGPQP